MTKPKQTQKQALEHQKQPWKFEEVEEENRNPYLKC